MCKVQERNAGKPLAVRPRSTVIRMTQSIVVLPVLAEQWQVIL